MPSGRARVAAGTVDLELPELDEEEQVDEEESLSCADKSTDIGSKSTSSSFIANDFEQTPYSGWKKKRGRNSSAKLLNIPLDHWFAATKPCPGLI